MTITFYPENDQTPRICETSHSDYIDLEVSVLYSKYGAWNFEQLYNLIIISINSMNHYLVLKWSHAVLTITILVKRSQIN